MSRHSPIRYFRMSPEIIRPTVMMYVRFANIVEAVKAGHFSPSMKDELLALEERTATLIAETTEAKEEMPRLHPGFAEAYRKQVPDGANRPE